MNAMNPTDEVVQTKTIAGRQMFMSFILLQGRIIGERNINFIDYNLGPAMYLRVLFTQSYALML